MRSKFDEQLELLNHEMILMGSLCERSIAMSARALFGGNLSATEEAAALSVQIDQKEREIQEMCLKLLLQRQPVARDLRAISSALKMITDMDRIGVQSADIAEIIATAGIHVEEDTLKIHDMVDAVMKMVRESIDAFVRQDLNVAQNVIREDDVVDRYFDEVKYGLIEHFSKPEMNGEYALDLLMIAKYLERIGDHAVNIAEWVIFSITGDRGEEQK